MFDLSRPDTEILPGPGTVYTMREAAAHADPSHTTVLFTACEASEREWSGVNMGRLCETWFNREYPHLATAYEKALTFNTIGEIEAMVRYVNQHPHITSATVVVKSWHAPRVHFFIDRLRAAGHLKVPVQVITHRYPWRIDIWNLGWRLREYVAYVYWYLKYDL